jgi:hypothetical protein
MKTVTTTGTSPSKPPQRAALDILRGRPKRRRRKLTAAEQLANERRFFDELVGLMEAGVVCLEVDRCELVPPLAEAELSSTSQPRVEQLELLIEGGEELFCEGCFWNWHRSCEREGCWLAEFERARK